MRCMLFKIAASFAKSWFCFHIKDRLLLTALLCFTWTNSVLCRTLTFPHWTAYRAKTHLLTVVCSFTWHKKTFPSTCDQTAHAKIHLHRFAFFAQNLPCVTVIDANFAYVYKFLIQKKQFAHGFRGIAKILLRRLFASAFIWKFIIGLRFAMRFQIIAHQVKCQFYRYRRPTFTAFAASLPTASITVAHVFSTTGEWK